MEIKNLLAACKKSIDAALVLKDTGFYEYSTQALLLTKDLSFSKHAANIAAFGQHFASIGIVPVHLHRYLIDAFDYRQAGDYDITITITLKQAEKELDRSKEFLKEITLAIQKLGYNL